MDPAGCFRYRAWPSIRKIEFGVAGIGIRLQNAAIAGEMRLRVLARAITGIVEHRRRCGCAAERSIVADIDPTSGGMGLSCRQDRNRRVVAVQPLCRKCMGFDPFEDRIEYGTASADATGHRRQAERNAFAFEALDLTVKRQMLAELVEQDHRQKIGAGPSARNGVEGGRSLADLLAVAAGELLAYRLDHFPLARNDLEDLGDVLTQLAQTVTATALAAHGPGHDDAFARKMLGERLLQRPAAGKAGDIDGGRGRHFGCEFVLDCRHLQLYQLELHLVDQPGTTLRLRAIKLPLELFDAQLLSGNDGKIVGRLGLGNGKFSLDLGALGACRDELCP